MKAKTATRRESSASLSPSIDAVDSYDGLTLELERNEVLTMHLRDSLRTLSECDRELERHELYGLEVVAMAIIDRQDRIRSLARAFLDVALATSKVKSGGER